MELFLSSLYHGVIQHRHLIKPRIPIDVRIRLRPEEGDPVEPPCAQRDLSMTHLEAVVEGLSKALRVRVSREEVVAFPEPDGADHVHGEEVQFLR